MIVLKTIPAIPEVPAIVDSIHKVTSVRINFLDSTVIFDTTSNYKTDQTHPFAQSVPVSRVVTFAEIGAKVTGPEVAGFAAVIRNAVALSMDVTIDKVPSNIFAQ